ncbi:MAG: efflux RND transporter periplasmic adaptor subunit [Asticcacaulis sp.]|uniref:efflux RND transporter periplasmic adaptor subunit n=1 Tax=Asticcacaulis sp. TaxID=1872648 RepID=UPI003F7B76AD
MMKINRYFLFRLIPTLVVVVAAIFVARGLWRHYEEEPWTRDGRVRADVVEVAPDVSGLITSVAVRDNQKVKAGDLLFTIDQPRYRLAVEQAQAAIIAQQPALREARQEAARNHALGDLVAAEVTQQSDAKVAALQAALDQSRVALDAAKLNLSRTEVRAPIDGIINNMSLRPGNFAATGHPEFALLASNSVYIVGYFEETKLKRIHVGDKVRARLMGDDAIIDGHVDSIASGIDERDGADGASLLANVNPTFSWVRLAQRIPVRVQIDKAPSGVNLVAGRTATVEIVQTGAAQ